MTNYPPRKVWVQTYGCQMNIADSERILALLSDMNYSKADSMDEAQLIIFNTCAIRDHANQKFYSHLGSTKHLKARGAIIGVGGCIAQIEGKDLAKKYPHLDFAFGTDMIDSMPEMVFRALEGERGLVFTGRDKSEVYSTETRITHQSPCAFVNIMKGCDKFCSYCIVPFTRGREKSRRLSEVVTDVRQLVETKGIQDITLLGQNVNSFGKENGESLTALLHALNAIDGLEVIRYTTSHPYDITDDLIEAHGTLSKLANHLHLPVQSGSTSVLERMNRQYTADHYLNLLSKLRATNPAMVITSDIIAGFPNETDSEHQATLDLLDAAQFDSIYSYAFSPRPGTKAAKIDDTLSDERRMKRLHEIQAKQLSIQNAIRAKLVGTTCTILIDGKNAMKGTPKWQGRTNALRIVHVPAMNDDDFMWHWADVEITSATSLSFQGKFIRQHGRRPSKLIK